MHPPSADPPDGSPLATHRRTLLRVGGALAAAATAGTAGCFGAPSDRDPAGDGQVAGDDGGEGTAGGRPTYPVDARLDLLPGEATYVTYVHVRDLLADPVYTAFIDAMLGRTFGRSGGPDSIDAARAAFDGALPVAFDGLRELASTTLVSEDRYGAVNVAWTDWDREPVFGAVRSHLTDGSLEERTHAGSPMLVRTDDDAPVEYGLAVGSLGDGRFAMGTSDIVERVHEIAAGERDPMGGVLRDGMLAAPDGPARAALEPPQVAESETETGMETATAGDGESSDDTGTPPPSPTPPADGTDDDTGLWNRIRYTYGGVYADGDRRGVALTAVAAPGEAGGLASRFETTLHEQAGPAEPGSPLGEAITEATVRRDGDRVTVRYEAPAADLESLAGAIERQAADRPPTTTVTTGTPEPEPVEILSATGHAEDGAVGAIEFVLRHRGNAEPVDVRDLYVRLAGETLPSNGLAFFHPAREEAQPDSGRFETTFREGTAPHLEGAGDRVAVRLDLGADSQDDDLAPHGDPLQPGTRAIAILGDGVFATAVRLRVPDPVPGETVSLVVD